MVLILWIFSVYPIKHSKNKEYRIWANKRLWRSEFKSASNLTPTLACRILIYDSSALCAWRCVSLFCSGLVSRCASWSSGSDTALVRAVTADLWHLRPSAGCRYFIWIHFTILKPQTNFTLWVFISPLPGESNNILLMFPFQLLKDPLSTRIPAVSLMVINLPPLSSSAAPKHVRSV